MTLTIRSSNSFGTLRILRSLKTSKEFRSIICLARIRPSCGSRAVSLVQEANVSPEKPAVVEKSSNNEKWEKFHELTTTHHGNGARVPVYVMLPLDTVSIGGSLNKPRAMNASLMALKSAGVEGVMVDVWWGLVEKDGPLKYNWEGYEELVNMVQRLSLSSQYNGHDMTRHNTT